MKNETEEAKQEAPLLNKPICVPAKFKGDEYKNVIEKLKSRHKSLHLKPFKGTSEKTYEIYINGKARMFTTDKGSYFLVVGIDLEHHLRRNYVESLAHKSFPEEKAFKEQKPASQNFPLPKENPVFFYDEARLVCYNHKINLLSEAQFKLLNTKNPKLIKGPPGSGKTLLGLEILAAKAIQAHGNNRLRLLYTAKSPNLVKDVEGKFKGHLYASKIEHLKKHHAYLQIDFKPIDEVLAKDIASVSKESDEDFNAWIKEHRHYLNQRKKFPAGLAFLFEDPRLLRGEFEVIAGKAILKDYEALGERSDSFVKDKAHRKIVFQAFQSHRKALRQKGQLPLCSGPNKAFYDLIIYDESQDGSEEDLRKVFQLANGEVVFLDSKMQRIHKGLSNEANYMNLDTQFYDLQVYNLSESFRNPGNVCRVINHISLIERDFLKSLGNKQRSDPEIVPQNEKIGKIKWREAPPKKPIQNIDHAIITLAKYKQKAIAAFGTSMVFTIDEIKGLEFSKVTLLDFFDDEEFEEISRILGNKAAITDKDRAAPEVFLPAFSKVKTALSRTTEDITIIQRPKHEIQNFLEEVKKGLPLDAFLPDEEEEQASSEDQMLQRAKELWFSGEHREQAEGILSINLKKTPEECTKIIEGWKGEKARLKSAAAKPQTQPLANEGQTNSGTSSQEEKKWDYEDHVQCFQNALAGSNKKNLKTLNALFSAPRFTALLEQSKKLLESGQHISLFQSVLEDKKKTANLIKMLPELSCQANMAKYLSLFAEKDPASLCALATHAQCIEIFKYFVEKTDFPSQISEKSFYFAPKPLLGHHSLATFLASSPENCILLKKILKANKDLNAAVQKMLTKKGEDTIKATYFLQALILTKKGRKIIEKMKSTSKEFEASLDAYFPSLCHFPVPKYLSKEAVQAALKQHEKICRSHQTKPTQERITEGIQLVEKLTEKVSEENLEKLFQQKDLLFLLFEKPLLKHASLFDHLISNKDLQEKSTFHSFLIKNSAACRILAKVLCTNFGEQKTPFFKLAKVAGGVFIIRHCLRLEPEIGISKAAFFEREEEHAAWCYLLLLKMTDTLIDILERDNNKLLNEIEGKDFSFPIEPIATNRNGHTFERSPSLLNFLVSGGYFELLEFFLDAKPGLITESFLKDCDEFLALRSSELMLVSIQNTCIMRLGCTTEGCEFMAQILLKLEAPEVTRSTIYKTLRSIEPIWDKMSATESGKKIEQSLKAMVRSKKGPEASLTAPCAFFANSSNESAKTTQNQVLPGPTLPSEKKPDKEAYGNNLPVYEEDQIFDLMAEQKNGGGGSSLNESLKPYLDNIVAQVDEYRLEKLFKHEHLFHLLFKMKFKHEEDDIGLFDFFMQEPSAQFDAFQAFLGKPKNAFASQRLAGFLGTPRYALNPDHDPTDTLFFQLTCTNTGTNLLHDVLSLSPNTIIDPKVLFSRNRKGVSAFNKLLRCNLKLKTSIGTEILIGAFKANPALLEQLTIENACCYLPIDFFPVLKKPYVGSFDLLCQDHDDFKFLRFLLAEKPQILAAFFLMEVEELSKPISNLPIEGSALITLMYAAKTGDPLLEAILGLIEPAQRCQLADRLIKLLDKHKTDYGQGDKNLATWLFKDKPEIKSLLESWMVVEVETEEVLEVGMRFG